MCVDLIMKRKELLGITESEDDKNIDESKTVEDTILSCKIVEIVYLNAIKQANQESIPDLVFQMIKVAYQFKFTKNLIDTMYKL